MTTSPRDEFKTSVRIVGERQVDEFQALCVYFGRRPHQLAADMVLDEIRRYRRRQKIAEVVSLLVKARREYREHKQAVAGGAVDLNEYRRARR